MSLGSGEELSNFTSKPGNLSETTFVPRTDTYDDENRKVTNDSPQNINSKRGNLYTTATTLNGAINNATLGPVLYSAPAANFTALILKTISTEGGATMPSPPNNNNNSVVLIVGATCGGIGLLIGIIIAVMIWVYFTKRKNQWNQYRSRTTSALERNPKEMTFEPLDLSLTLPNYGHANVSQKRESFAGIPSADSTPAQTSRFRERHNHSYHGFDPPSPPLPNATHCKLDFLPGSNFEQTENHHPNLSMYGNQGEMGLKESTSETLKEKISSISDDNVTGRMKRPTSISTRDSFSSGLGTGTESDFLPSENLKNIRSPSCTSEYDSHQMQFQLPVSNVSGNKRYDPKRRSNNSGLRVVRENTSRNIKHSVTGYPIRSDQKSDTSGSRGSSATPSTNEWSSSTDTSYSPSSTIPSSIGTFPTPLHPTPPSISEEENIQRHDSSKWSSNESTDDETDWSKNDDTGDQEGVVSSYFDMRFPSSPLRSTIPRSSRSHSPGPTLPPVDESRPIDLVRQDSDVIINL